MSSVCVLCAQSLSCVWLFVTSWTAAHQASMSMEFSRKEYWSGLPLPSPRDLLDLGTEHVSCISCIGKWILYHWATWEAPYYGVLLKQMARYLTPRLWLHFSVSSIVYISSVSSVAKLCPTLCYPMDCSTLSFPVHHQLPELVQIHVHRIDDAIQKDFIFLGSKITAYGDWSHEIKRCLLPWRKIMTNLRSILKSRDITLPTKGCIVKL